MGEKDGKHLLPAFYISERYKLRRKTLSLARGSSQSEYLLLYLPDIHSRSYFTATIENI